MIAAVASNPVLAKMLTQPPPMQPMAGPSSTPDAMNALPSPAPSGMGQFDPEVKDFYRTHPGRHPMDEKPGGIEPRALAPQAPMPKPLATVQPAPKSPGYQQAEAEFSRLTAPPPTDPALLHTKANTGAPGVQQVHNPVGRVLGTIADAIGTGLFPGIAMAVPGTTAHHMLLTKQAGNALTEQGKDWNIQNTGQLDAAKAQHDLNTPAAKTDIHSIYANAVQDAMARGVSPKDDPIVKEALSALQDASAKPPQEKEDVHAILAEKIRDAQRRGVDPNEDPAVKQLIATIQSTASPGADKTLQDTEGIFYTDKGGKATPVTTVDGQPLKGKAPNQPNIPLEEQVINEHLQKVHPGETMAQARAHTQPPPQRAPSEPPIVYTPGPNGTMVPTQARLGTPLPTGTVTSGGMSTEATQANKQVVDEQRAIADNQKAYQMAQRFAADQTGSSDVGLVMQFIGAVKPESMGKIRFTPQEQNFVISTRSSLGDLDALLNKVSNGQKLIPQQRQEMLRTMKIVAFPGGDGGGGATGGAQGTGGWSVKVVGK